MKATSSRCRAAILAAIVLGSVSTAPRALAQQHYSAGDVAQARELYNQGLALRDKGDLAGAAEKLRAAHALATTPITGLELGRVYVTMGKLVEAREALLSVGRLGVARQETARSAAARKEADQLAEQVRVRIPSLVVKITGVPLDSVAVTIDGAAVPNEALAAPRLVNPGSHELQATSTSGGSTSTTVDVKEGETRTVELKIVFTPAPPHPEATPAPVTPAPESGASQARQAKTLDWVLLGAGGAVAVGGGVLMLVEAGRASSARSNDNAANSASSVAEYNSTKTPYYLGLAAVIAGGAAAAAGAVLLAMPSAEVKAGTPATAVRATPWMAPGSGGVRIEGAW